MEEEEEEEEDEEEEEEKLHCVLKEFYQLNNINIRNIFNLKSNIFIINYVV